MQAPGMGGHMQAPGRRRTKQDVCDAFLEQLRERGDIDIGAAGFIEGICQHFERLPTRYALDVNTDSLDVLSHKRLLDEARLDPTTVSFAVRSVEVLHSRYRESSDSLPSPAFPEVGVRACAAAVVDRGGPGKACLMLRWRVCLLQQQCSNLLTGVYLWLLIAAITPARDHAASSTQTAAAKASIWLFAKPPGVLARQQGVVWLVEGTCTPILPAIGAGDASVGMPSVADQCISLYALQCNSQPPSLHQRKFLAWSLRPFVLTL